MLDEVNIETLLKSTLKDWSYPVPNLQAEPVGTECCWRWGRGRHRPPGRVASLPLPALFHGPVSPQGWWGMACEAVGCTRCPWGVTKDCTFMVMIQIKVMMLTLLDVLDLVKSGKPAGRRAAAVADAPDPGPDTPGALLSYVAAPVRLKEFIFVILC